MGVLDADSLQDPVHLQPMITPANHDQTWAVGWGWWVVYVFWLTEIWTRIEWVTISNRTLELRY